MSWFDDLKSEVMTFFEKATEKDIQLALEKSNYAFYKDIDVPILDFHEKIYERVYEWIGPATLRVSLKLSEQMMIKNESTCFEEIEAADNYGYALAA